MSFILTKCWLQSGSMHSYSCEFLLEHLRSVSLVLIYFRFEFMFSRLNSANFCSGRSAPLSLLEFKQTMLILCDTQNYDQLVVDEFEIAADHNRCVNRYRFESIMSVLSKFFSFLENNSMYSAQAAEGIVQECYKQVC